MEAQTDVDAILIALGSYGRYQMLQFGYLLVSMIPISFPVLIYVFIGHVPPFQCKNMSLTIDRYIDSSVNSSLDDLDIRYGKCDVTVYNAGLNTTESSIATLGCKEGYSFQVDGGETIISEWELVCDRQGLGEFSTTAVLIGQMIGAVIFTPLADKFGRLPISCVTHMAMFLFSIGLAFIPTFSGFVILRFIIGAFQQGVGLAHSTVAVELFPRQSRGKMVFMASITWATCIMSLSVIGFLLRNYSWRYLQLAGGLMSFHSLFSPWIQCESLRWLVVNRKIKEAKKWIRTAAKMNNKNAEEIISLIYPESDENVYLEEQQNLTVKDMNNVNNTDPDQNDTMRDKEKEDSNLHKDEKKLSWIDIFKERILLKYTVIIWLCWITDGMTYYGLFLTSQAMPGNRYLNFVLNVIAEIPGNIIFILMIDRWGRKITTVLLHGVAGASLIISVILLTIEDNSVASTFSVIFNFMGKIGISGSFNVVFLYTPELYPTNLRNFGIGAASSAARIGGMVAPYSAILASYVIWGPGVIFGSACILITIISLFLPETMGRELPQSVDEMKEWSKKTKNIHVSNS